MSFESYDVIVADKWAIGDLIESISVDESLDQVAMSATVKCVVTPDWPAIQVGNNARIIGYPYGVTDYKVSFLHPGVVWTLNSDTLGTKEMTLTIFDKTVYLAKSEDQYLFNEGETADFRIRRICTDWDIPIKTLPNTGVKLARQVIRGQTIATMLQNFLTETAVKGGSLYRARMTPQGLEVFELGTNSTVWKLETDQTVEELTQNRTLEGSITKVKVLGKSSAKTAVKNKNKPGTKTANASITYDYPDSEQLHPVAAIATGDVDNFGTLQKIIEDSTRIKTVYDATTLAESMLYDLQQTFTVRMIDINTMRVGDKVNLNGMDLIVTGITHDFGEPGHMTLQLADIGYVRWKFYNESI